MDFCGLNVSNLKPKFSNQFSSTDNPSSMNILNTSTTSPRTLRVLCYIQKL